MKCSGSGRGTRRDSYHHGNLREALIQAALALIAERGPAGFTFADVARSTGVSPAAPYRHFRDLDELKADVARRGFERFAAVLAQAWNEGRPDPLTAIEMCGRAYLAFARAEPAYFAAMFESGSGTDADLLQAGDRAFGVLRTAAETLCAQVPRERRPPPLMVSLHIWSMVHGIASLFVGPGGKRPLPMSPEDLLEAGLLIYLRSLGLIPDGSSNPPPADTGTLTDDLTDNR
jgi:AcrR family transcriptional regulator